MRARVVVSVAVVAMMAVVASCDGQMDCTVSASSCESNALTYALTPASLTLAVGDTASVAIAVQQGGRTVTPKVRWTQRQPAIVVLDSQTVTRTRARVQAASEGSSSIDFLVSVGGQSFAGSVPITVNAR